METFFPEKDRFSLAILLNNFLAAPAFQTWMEGQALDAASFLYTPDGRPRHSIFYIAHLSESERMFFVTLLFSAVETWMRAQSGSTALRALLYFDEIVGYLPPAANPPSKPVLLRMLKQARAFGLGLLLATQNPVDVDYKALSNAGTWFIGKLQTDQDKQRLLDGLQGAAPDLERSELDRMISGLDKRVFLLHNVHAPHPVLFQTRWTMNYLAGPLTRAQIPALNRLVQPTAAAAAPEPAQPAVAPVQAPPQPAAEAVAPPTSLEASSTTRPALPAGVAEYFMPNDFSLSEALSAVSMALPANAPAPALLYRPALVAQASIRYLERRHGMDFERKRTALVTDPDRRGQVRWDDCPYAALAPERLGQSNAPGARFTSLDAPLSDAKMMAAMQKDFLDWAYRSSTVRARANQALNVFAGPEVSTAEFRERCSQAARQGRDAETAKVAATYERKLSALNDKLAREQRELKQDEQELSERRMEELGSGAEFVLGLLGGRKRSVSTSLSKRRMSQQARADVEELQDAIADMQKQLAALEKEKAAAVQEVNERWAKLVDEVSELPVTPQKQNIFPDLFGVLWLPYYVLDVEGKVAEIPAFSGN